jgi:hypothetical protein
MPPRAFLFAVTLAAALSASAPVRAGEPLTFANGHIRLGGEVSGTYSGEDPGYFNYTDYQGSMLRLFRVSLDAEARLGPHLALLGEVRTDNLHSPRAYALYLRLRPWENRSFDIQAGRIPPVFGGYPRRRYSVDNPLPGLPLAYQYLTSLRPDVAPVSPDDLYLRQGTGWLVRYPTVAPAPGLPLVNVERWDVGVEVRVGQEPVQLAMAVTQGTLSDPRARDDNDGRQFSGRLAWRPFTGLLLGVSGAGGPYLSSRAVDALPAPHRARFLQRAAGLDAEYAAGYWILRAETVWSAFDVPPLSPGGADRLDALDVMFEVRYKVAPGFYLAGRADHMGFSRPEWPRTSLAWDAPVSRIEAGFGLSLRRDLLLKASFQHNHREGGYVHTGNVLAGQLAFWF